MLNLLRLTIVIKKWKIGVYVVSNNPLYKTKNQPWKFKLVINQKSQGLRLKAQGSRLKSSFTSTSYNSLQSIWDFSKLVPGNVSTKKIPRSFQILKIKSFFIQWITKRKKNTIIILADLSLIRNVSKHASRTKISGLILYLRHWVEIIEVNWNIYFH